MIREISIYSRYHELLSSALDQIGPWMGKHIKVDRSWCFERLQERIHTTNWKKAREDVRRFVKSNEQPSLDLWSAEKDSRNKLPAGYEFSQAAAS